ncbi:T9SS type A sorting domain-containing protein, partial [candidate division WOR-3 bacterium]|nr:T9SS type A sorting domain-containing protein [candidate division WOR-3 bacterium]
STKQQRYQVMAGYNHIDYDTLDPEASYRPFPSWGNNNPGYPGQNEDVLAANDKRFIMSCGPFDLPYGDSVSIVFAIAISNNPDDIIEHSLLIINFWNNYFNNKITLLAPADSAEISSNTNFSWQPFAEKDSFRFDIASVYNDTALMFTGINTGTYNFNSLSLPDGKYAWNVWNYDHNFFESFSSKRLVIINNPNINGAPHIDEFDANIPSDRCYLTWDIFDPDGDNILKDIFIIRELYNDTILYINTYDDNYSFSAYNYLPDGDYKAFIRAIDDSLASDSSCDYFSYNGTRPQDVSSATGGNNNTILINAVAYNIDLIKANKYTVHFDYPIRTEIYPYYYLYLPYTVYDSTESALVLSDTAIFDITQSVSTYYTNGNHYYSPLFDGIGLEINIADSFLMSYDSVKVIVDIGTAYPESLLVIDDIEDRLLFGGRDIDLHWHLNGDSIYVDPTLSGYTDIVPYDIINQYNYLFGTASSAYEYLNNSTTSRSVMYIAGTRLYFNAPGRIYPMDTLWYPDEGEIWRIYSSGDRLPIKGDVYTFIPSGIDNRSNQQALMLNLNNHIIFNNALIMNITGYGICDINLYDITGRMVNKLFSGAINGYRSISLKQSLPTGIYFIKETNDKFNAEKIIIMK